METNKPPRRKIRFNNFDFNKLDDATDKVFDKMDDAADKVFDKMDNAMDSITVATDKTFDHLDVVFQKMDKMFDNFPNFKSGKYIITQKGPNKINVKRKKPTTKRPGPPSPQPKKKCRIDDDFRRITIDDLIAKKERQQHERLKRLVDRKYNSPPPPPSKRVIKESVFDKFLGAAVTMVDELIVILTTTDWSKFKFVKCLKTFFKHGQWSQTYVEPKEKKWWRK